jgi:hypothetical protein
VAEDPPRTGRARAMQKSAPVFQNLLKSMLREDCRNSFMTLPPVLLQEQLVMVLFIGRGFDLLVASYG